MIYFSRISLLMAAIVVAADIAYAATEFKFESGECDNGNRWWSVSEFNRGLLMQVSGIDCDGISYVRYPERKNVAVDPTAGATPTFTGDGWHASIRYDALRRVVWAGGKDMAGNYWVTTAITYDDSGTGGDEEENAITGEDDIR